MLVLASASACKSSDSTADKGSAATDKQTSTTAAASTAPDAAQSSGTTPSDGGGGGSSTCVKDTDRMSGSSTVVWTADSKSEHQGTEATEATTMLIQADGTLKPSELTVKVGEVFTFGLAEGTTEIAAIIVGCSGGQTVYKGPALAAEYITTPGTYDIVNDLGSKKLGTITVK